MVGTFSNKRHVSGEARSSFGEAESSSGASATPTAAPAPGVDLGPKLDALTAAVTLLTQQMATLPTLLAQQMATFQSDLLTQQMASFQSCLSQSHEQYMATTERYVASIDRLTEQLGKLDLGRFSASSDVPAMNPDRQAIRSHEVQAVSQDVQPVPGEQPSFYEAGSTSMDRPEASLDDFFYNCAGPVLCYPMLKALKMYNVPADYKTQRLFFHLSMNGPTEEANQNFMTRYRRLLYSQQEDKRSQEWLSQQLAFLLDTTFDILYRNDPDRFLSPEQEDSVLRNARLAAYKHVTASDVRDYLCAVSHGLENSPLSNVVKCRQLMFLLPRALKVQFRDTLKEVGMLLASADTHPRAEEWGRFLVMQICSLLNKQIDELEDAQDNLLAETWAEYKAEDVAPWIWVAPV
ncbi:hypothetical protein CKK34_6077 [Yarrowia sp. E02]|nr:hypothetical protein CKK34_6077 [Yarrowia sp. E02]